VATNLTIDRNGVVYLNVGGTIGKSATAISGSIVAGGFENAGSMSASDIESALTGYANNVSGGYIAGFGHDGATVAGDRSIFSSNWHKHCSNRAQILS
jgi:hypothetical protein